jgi:capsular polysaccharide biosynthesis protein
MSQGMLSPRGLLRKVRRRWAAVAATAALGLAAGAAVAHSDAVLSAAGRGVSPAVSLATLRSRVRVTTLTPRVLSIRAQAATAAQAVSTANAVARSYVAYVRAPQSTAGQPPAYLLDMAVVATRTPLARRMATAGGLGALMGALIRILGAPAARDA